MLLLGAVAAAAIIAVTQIQPITQDPNYHAFADQRMLLGIPNFWNVVSNAAFVPAGLFGLWAAFRRARWIESRDKWPWAVAAAGVILVALGSGYYHWTPNNQTLFWDRLPMTLVFMAILSAIVNERVHSPAGVALLAPFLMLGILSVEVWRRGEMTGVGDLRFYVLVQFYPMLAIPLMMWLFRPRYTHGSAIWWMVLWYAIAKVFEAQDARVFEWTSGLMSGHALKHPAGAAALWIPFRALTQRRETGSSA